MAGVMFGKSQLFVREGISEVHHRRDEPPAADRLAGYRLLGAVARTLPAGVPSYLLPGVRPFAAQAAHELSVAYLSLLNHTSRPRLSTIIGPSCPAPFFAATKM